MGNSQYIIDFNRMRQALRRSASTCNTLSLQKRLGPQAARCMCATSGRAVKYVAAGVWRCGECIWMPCGTAGRSISISVQRDLLKARASNPSSRELAQRAGLQAWTAGISLVYWYPVDLDDLLVTPGCVMTREVAFKGKVRSYHLTSKEAAQSIMQSRTFRASAKGMPDPQNFSE